MVVVPTVDHPIAGQVIVPGSKSVTNRAIILSILGIPGVATSIKHGLSSRDSELMLGAARELGATVDGTFPDEVTITPPQTFHGGTINVGLAGTVMRFLPPLAALATNPVYFFGDSYASQRPIATLLNTLRELSITIDGDSLPFTVRGNGTVSGGTVHIDASASSQFISALLLSGSRYESGITVIHSGSEPPSLPHISMTVNMVQQAGGRVETQTDADNSHYAWSVAPSAELSKPVWDIEPDLSNATVFFAAAAVTGGSVSVPHWPQQSLQPVPRIKELFEQLGATWSTKPDPDNPGEYIITVTGGEIHGLEANLRDVSEITPTLVAIAALADSPSLITGIGHIRGHETDRIAALAREINSLGGLCKEYADGLEIIPRPLHPGTWTTYADHRMATTAAIMGLRYAGIDVDDISVTTKTMPQFLPLWNSLVKAHCE